MAGKRFTVDAVFRGINKITKPVRSMGRSVSKFVKQSNRKIDKLGRNFLKLGSIMGKALKRGAAFAAVGIAGLGAAVFSVVKQFTKLENAEAAFTPLLGGAKKAKKLVDELNKTAATTPFQFENLSGAANQLLPVMNGNIQKTVKTLRMLGDTAGGNAQKLESITRGFTKAMLKGKVDMESLNMIAEAGVPIFGDLAKVMGTKVGTKFFKEISAGKVTTDQLTKAFENMTSKGGMFFKGMDIASKTTTGVISTMKDNISLAAAALGKILAPIVKKYAKQVTEMAKNIKTWVQENEGLIKSGIDTFLKTTVSAIRKVVAVVKVLIPVLKTMAKIGKAAFGFIMFFSPFLKPFIATLLVFKGVLIAVALATKVWAIATGVLNAVMAVNPVSLIIIAIAALIGIIVVLANNWDTIVEGFKIGISKIVSFFVFLFEKIKAFTKIIWSQFNKLLDNPFFRALATIFLPFITIPALIIKHWEPIKEFFNDLMETINGALSAVGGFFKKVGGVFGLGGGEDSANKAKAVTPQERLSRSIQENTDRSIQETRSESNSVLTIKDQTGRADLKTSGPNKNGGLVLARSGAF